MENTNTLVEGPLPHLFSRLYQGNVFAYILVSSSTLLVYDYLLSIHEEYEFIWSSKWTWMKVLYIIQRYMPLGDTAILFLTATFKLNPTPEFCHHLMTTSTYPTMDTNTIQVLAPESFFNQQVEKPKSINCILSSNEEHISSIVFSLGVIYQIGIVALTLSPGVHAYKNRKFSPMFKAVYRNGLLVNLIFIVTEIFSIISLMLW
ncbi:hypothetical protein K435DRAFT_834566, partial [Dendrothele bispora CBS 962.96]